MTWWSGRAGPVRVASGLLTRRADSPSADPRSGRSRCRWSGPRRRRPGACAAICASVVRLPATPAVPQQPEVTRTCRSSEVRYRVTGRSSHLATEPDARSVAIGVESTRRLVTSRRKPEDGGVAQPDGAGAGHGVLPPRAGSARAARNASMWAYSSRLTSGTIIGPGDAATWASSASSSASPFRRRGRCPRRASEWCTSTVNAFSRRRRLRARRSASLTTCFIGRRSRWTASSIRRATSSSMVRVVRIDTS